MNNKSILVVISGALVLMLGIWLGNQVSRSTAVLGTRVDQNSTPTPTPVSRQLVATVVPHHELARAFNDDLFATAARQNRPPERILIIGPQHYPTPARAIATNNFPARSPVFLSDELIARDHAYANQLPFIKQYFPHTPVYALLLSSQIGVDTLHDLRTHLHDNFPLESTLIVASVDFSHYLTPPQMRERDAQMRAWLLSDDPSTQFIGLGDEYTDSWASLYLLFSLMKKQGATHHVIDYTNSTEILDNPRLNTATSYFHLQWLH